MTRTSHSVIDLPRFIQATRDSGYKGTSSAVAELVDNSIQAGASQVVVTITRPVDEPDSPPVIHVADNGSGMTGGVLREALRFGGSTRFGARHGLGRFGMGLPNASLSQSTRVEVVTWTSPRSAFVSYLDVDEIAAGVMSEVPLPKRTAIPDLGRAPCGSGARLQALHLGRGSNRHQWCPSCGSRSALSPSGIAAGWRRPVWGRP